MAMLSEPRRKQKVINLRAKNNAWSNDTNKFGQRMLEKMGWSSGKGLGANENGIVEHVVARYKNDEKGLGFEDKNDQWTKHDDDFNALLANLSNGDSNEEKLHSGVSLEVKSKKSKARVHYHKFTRGKDLTRYSEKDLANIFGKKSLKNEEKVEETFKVDDKATENFFTEKGSMEDYFKNKLASFKLKSKTSILNCNQNDEEANYAFRGFSRNANDELDSHQVCEFKSFSFGDTSVKEIEEVNHKTLSECDIVKRKKIKKNKKFKTPSPVVSEEISQDNASINSNNSLQDDSLNINKQDNDLQELPKKTKKKCKIENTEPVENALEYEHDEDVAEFKEQPLKIKKLKKKKYLEQQVLEITENIKECGDNNYVPKKKKKRKNKDIEN